MQAEHALAREMRSLTIHSNDLEAQATALDAQIAKLDCARQQVEAHLSDKGTGEDVQLPFWNSLLLPLFDACSRPSVSSCFALIHCVWATAAQTAASRL